VSQPVCSLVGLMDQRVAFQRQHLQMGSPRQTMMLRASHFAHSRHWRQNLQMETVVAAVAVDLLVVAGDHASVREV